jgi:hypothetical protein
MPDLRQPLRFLLAVFAGLVNQREAKALGFWLKVTACCASSSARSGSG